MTISKFVLKSFENEKHTNEPSVANLERLQDIQIPIQFVLASTERTLQDVDYFKKGTYISLEKEADLPIDILAGGKVVGKAIILVDAENKLLFKIV
ncbi:flagellar motor switch protein [compost metagenome]